VFEFRGFFQKRLSNPAFQTRFWRNNFVIAKTCFQDHMFYTKKENIRVFEIRFLTKVLDSKFGGQKCMCIGLGQSLEISHNKLLKSGSGPCGIDASGLHLLTNRIFSPLCEEVIKAFRKAFPCAEFKMGRMTVSASLYQAVAVAGALPPYGLV
jgi:hypothetical protein